MKILAMSDQHRHLPAIPPCDLLIVAGDQCPDVIGGLAARVEPERQWRWFCETWLRWRNEQPVAECLVTWGNHDFCGLAHRAADFMTDGKRTRIVCDDVATIGGLKIYLTPWSNTFMRWAFMRDPADLARVYAAIPEGIDILVSHQPPLGYGSQCRYLDVRDGQWKEEHVGSVELIDAILRVRPAAVVCGHVHSAFGTYDCDGIPIYNVSVVDEGYSLVNPPTVIAAVQASQAQRVAV